ncbi:MAG: iron-containing redox enzyme family protein [Alphaproteobacteria bacterium]|nr:iron-containing redox enzyme family protein [Alphaproteobacteria bacterium]
MTRTSEQFREAILDLLQEMRWDTPTILEDFLRNHLTREGALVYGLEHCVFAANFPRWLANITGNCPHLEVRKYLIENMFVEEVKDPTIPTGHYESLVDFVDELGAEREFVLAYTGAPVTKMRIAYCDWVSRTKPWLEAFAAIAGNEVARGKAMIERVGERARTSRDTFASLGLSETALAHWDSADAADGGEGGHGDAPLDFLDQFADTREKQDSCLAAMRERQEVNRIWSDQVGVWCFEASGLIPPSIDKRQPRPEPVLAA